MKISSARNLALAFALALSPLAVGCAADTGQSSDDVTDVPHTPVERQSIGNCWLYAEASWVESMNLAATGVAFDVSQSYWTFWHWYDQIVDGASEISTGGSFWVAEQIIRERGLMDETKFVAEDSTSEMSYRQSQALSAINAELATGRLSTYEARTNRQLALEVLKDAWQLTPTVKGWITKAFGADASLSFDDGSGSTYGTAILSADEFAVRYTERRTDPSVATVKDTSLDVALDEWNQASYPSWSGDSQKRSFQIRVQRALHDAQPVVITWDVDFNAMESWDPELKGSFNLTTLERAGSPGRQGGHMTVLEDYEIETTEFGTLEAGVTLDPQNPDDAAKLEAALDPSSTIKFFRIKNSWGALRDDRSSAPGFPGYHDLYMDYLHGPITWCPSVEGTKTAENCTGTSRPLRAVVLPPGY